MLGVCRQALAAHSQAKEYLAEVQGESAWKEVDVIKTVIREAGEKIPAFVAQYKERVVKRACEDKIRECSSALQTAKDMLDHHRHDARIQQTHHQRSKQEQLRSSQLTCRVRVRHGGLLLLL